jgi:methylase of polypeptide subunit release factors
MTQAKTSLKPGGYLLCEADPRQLDAIADYAESFNYKRVARRDFAIVFQT